MIAKQYLKHSQPIIVLINSLSEGVFFLHLNFWPQLFSNFFGEPSKFKTLCSSASYQFEQVFNESKTIRVSEILPLEISNLVLYIAPSKTQQTRKVATQLSSFHALLF